MQHVQNSEVIVESKRKHCESQLHNHVLSVWALTRCRGRLGGCEGIPERSSLAQ